MKHRKTDRLKINYKVIATYGVAITLIGITAFSVYNNKETRAIGSPLSTPVYSAARGITLVRGNIGGFLTDIFSFKENARKVDELEKENASLKKQIADLRYKDNKRESLESLKDALGFVGADLRVNMKSAEIVAKNDGNWYESFVLSVGRDQGIKKDSIVVNGKGVVGIVYEVSKDYCKAISLMDSKASVSFKLEKSMDDKGVITNNISTQSSINVTDKGLLEGYLFNADADVVKGDVIVTSGMGLYPGGLPIGEVSNVIESKQSSLKYITVKPFVDFKRLNDCMIIEPRSLEQVSP